MPAGGSSVTPTGSPTFLVSTSKTLNAALGTANVPIFRVTGTVLVHKLYGIVTTVLGSNHTAAGLRVNDQTAQVQLTLVTGTSANAAPVGTFIGKTALAATAITVKSSAAGALQEPAGANNLPYQEFIVVKKSGANTDIEYSYTTTDNPHSGVVQYFCEYTPLSADGAVAAL